jgi:hypothetical protein
VLCLSSNAAQRSKSKEKNNVLRTYKIGLTTTVLAVALAGIGFRTAFAQKESVPINQNRVALGADEVKQLVELMDTDKSGKVSKAEYMAFFSAEFDRLDKDKSGELDVKELEKSMMRPAARANFSK